jgi:predicted Fe-S protein YdhL (DUF1289 family)
MNTTSPCTQVCELDDYDICTGCHRTRDEIARWTQMNDAERSRVNALVVERQFWAAKTGGPVANKTS